MNHLLMSRLLKKTKNSTDKGFTFLEGIVAILVISIAFALNGQFLVFLQVQNIKEKINTAAVALGSDILDDYRYRLGQSFTSVNVGKVTRTDETRFNFTFDADVYVCAAAPTIIEDPDNPLQLKVESCPLTGGNTEIRHIVVQVIDKGRSNEKIYTVQTSFAQLQR